jgi:hypothetical protein
MEVKTTDDSHTAGITSMHYALPKWSHWRRSYSGSGADPIAKNNGAPIVVCGPQGRLDGMRWNRTTVSDNNPRFYFEGNDR